MDSRSLSKQKHIVLGLDIYTNHPFMHVEFHPIDARVSEQGTIYDSIACTV